jgi:hypothetical protein
MKMNICFITIIYRTNFMPIMPIIIRMTTVTNAIMIMVIRYITIINGARGINPAPVSIAVMPMSKKR